MPRVVRAFVLTGVPASDGPKPAGLPIRCVLCRFCELYALPRREVCVYHVGLDGGSWLPCETCKTPIDRILGPLATQIDRLCGACGFRAKTRETLRRSGS